MAYAGFYHAQPRHLPLRPAPDTQGELGARARVLLGVCFAVALAASDPQELRFRHALFAGKKS